MKKILSSALIIMIMSACIAGCSSVSKTTQTSVETGTSDTAATTAPTTAATTVEETTVEETATEAPRGHFEFKTVVIPSILRDIMGEDMCVAYGNYVNAVLAGEDDFEVVDEKSYDWMIGQFPSQCFPLLFEYTGSNYGGAFSNGRATFQYKIPKDELAVKEAEFEKMVTDILNENLRDDYSDFEKVLALYLYFSENYTYDYDTYYVMEDQNVDFLSAYRFLTRKTGICCECATAFTYLLLQAGVDANNIGGNLNYNNEGHEWVYITINGRNYHVDPTYAMSSGNDLTYLMMTDDYRENVDCFEKETYSIGCHYIEEHNGYKYDADDDFFAPLRGTKLISWDPDKNEIRYESYDGTEGTFDYSPFG